MRMLWVFCVGNFLKISDAWDHDKSLPKRLYHAYFYFVLPRIILIVDILNVLLTDACNYYSPAPVSKAISPNVVICYPLKAVIIEGLLLSISKSYRIKNSLVYGSTPQMRTFKQSYSPRDFITGIWWDKALGHVSKIYLISMDKQNSRKFIEILLIILLLFMLVLNVLDIVSDANSVLVRFILSIIKVLPLFTEIIDVRKFSKSFLKVVGVKHFNHLACVSGKHVTSCRSPYCVNIAIRI